MSEARDRLEQYLARTGLSRPADGAEAYQVTLMRQWTDHLDDVLENNIPDWPELRSTIIREFIYGMAPRAAESELRAELSDDLLQYVRGRGVFPPDLMPGESSGMPPVKRPENRTFPRPWEEP